MAKKANHPLIVMISSTALDLPGHRREVMDACLQLGHRPKMMEHLPAADADAIEESRRLVEEADVYVGLFAHRYGFVPPGSEVSITEMEYRRARERGLSRLIFFMHEDHPITAGDVETGEGAAKLTRLKGEIEVERVVAFFKSPQDLRAHVLQALVALAERRRPDAAEPMAAPAPEVRLRPWPAPELPEEPYPLLLPYTHPALFAGRGRELTELRRLLSGPVPILGLHATSGVGKSSFLAAGLVPAERAAGRPVAFERRPADPGLATRLAGDLLKPGEGGDALAVDDEDPGAFVVHLLAAGRLAGKTPLLVLDQFEDLMRPESAAARARLGLLLAASVQRPAGSAGSPSRWLLAYRQDFHGRVRAWLRDVLLDARALELPAAGGLPYDLSDADRSHDWPLPPLGAPPAGSELSDAAQRAFREAIETPLAVAGDGGAPRYPWRFAGDGAERLARAFAEARAAQHDAPLVPELQVVLAHLLGQARKADGDQSGQIRVPAELETEIDQALQDHLRRALNAAFLGQPRAAAREGRTRTLLALRELADAEGKRVGSRPAGDLAASVGGGGAEVLKNLARRDTRLLVPIEQTDGRHYALSHDRLAELVVRMVEEEGLHGDLDLDRELLALRRSVRLSTELFLSGDREQATRIPPDRFQRIEAHREALIRDESQREWWTACEKNRAAEQRRMAAETRQRQAERRRRLILGVIGFIALGATLAAGRWWSVRRSETETLMMQLLSQDPDSLEALYRLVAEERAEVGELQEALRQRGTSLNLFEGGAQRINEESRYKAMATAVEVALPPWLYGYPEALNIDEHMDDLEQRGLLAWTLDYAVAHDPSLEKSAATLRREVLAELPPAPELNDSDWARIPAGSFRREAEDTDEEGAAQPAYRVVLSSFRMLRHEVTNEELRRLVHARESDEEDDDLRVAGVSWYTAYAYAAWLGGRLPTEAEWEYAARASCRFEYCNQEGEKAELKDVGWYSDHPAFGDESPQGPQRVMRLEPNPWGLYDMYGNAWEWVADWQHPYLAEEQTNPWGRPSGKYRVLRGGSYGSPAGEVRAAVRIAADPKVWSAPLGFRVVLPVAPSH